MIDNLKGKAVNKIPKTPVLETFSWKNPPEFEVTIKKDGEIVYQNKTYAGCLSLVQSIDKIIIDDPQVENMPSMEGDTQVLYWGHPCTHFFSFDQLRQKGRTAIALSGAWWQQLLKAPKDEQVKHIFEVAKRNSIKKI